MFWLWQSSRQKAEKLFCKILFLCRYILLNTNISIFTTVTFPLVLCECETYSLALRDEGV